MKTIQKKFSLKSIVVILLAILISGVTIGFTHIVTSPIIEKRQLALELETYQKVIPLTNDREILKEENQFKAVLVTDDNEAVIGVVYIVTESNAHGLFTLIAGVDTQGIILHTEFLSYGQSGGIYEDISRDNLAAFIGLNITDSPNDGDVISGATNSYASIQNAFNTIRTFHQTLTFENDNPFSEGVEGFYAVVLDNAFTSNETVLKKEHIVNNQDEVIGYIYTLYGSGPYAEGYDDASIQFYVVTDLNHEIVNIVVFDEEYLHSKGAFYRRITAYLDGFIGKNLNEAVIYDTDWASGATSGNSKALIDQMIIALMEVLS